LGYEYGCQQAMSALPFYEIMSEAERRGRESKGKWKVVVYEAEFKHSLYIRGKMHLVLCHRVYIFTAVRKAIS
jgi:hypothetical protein